nr:hypothetical protein [Methylomarinum sp. Ch1-1]MDP4520465.1 hypothetical protein [Methylomarinum sp. Ch1-1]
MPVFESMGSSPVIGKLNHQIKIVWLVNFAYTINLNDPAFGREAVHGNAQAFK